MRAGRLNHSAPIHRHKVNSAEWTRSEFCLWPSFPPPPTPTKSGLPPLPLLPPHWFSIKCSHDSPLHSQRFLYFQQIHTQALEQRIAPILNSHPTYSRPTVPTSSISPILQYSVDVIYTETHNLSHHLHRPLPWQ